VDLQLRGKAAVVTGAGRGIGAAVALHLGREGAHVVVNDIDGPAARGVAADITSGGSISLAVEADVTKKDQVENMISKALSEFGKLDILINNAGIAYDSAGPITRKLFQESSFEDWQKEIALILYGTMNCAKAVLEHMIKQRYGRIINISSDVAKTPLGLKGTSIYSTAKAGINALTRSLATEVAVHGITVNAVSPGMVRTTRALLAEQHREKRSKEYEYYKNFEKSVLGLIPLGRMGEPDDVAKLVVFLASDAARWITGQTFSVNGGLVMM
jgi:NAD(P)-dependent dehydrogenase (short-subunit alcohol dehydrogenase family)